MTYEEWYNNPNTETSEKFFYQKKEYRTKEQHLTGNIIAYGCYVDNCLGIEYEKKDIKKQTRTKDQLKETRRRLLIKLERDPFKKKKFELRIIVSQALIQYKKKNFILKKKTKKIIRAEELLGCSIEQFKQYIEQQFKPWMNWNNWGKITGKENETWQLDHRKAIANVNTEEELQEANRWYNFQPLCSLRNVRKGKHTFIKN